jgi:hypothetical protein
MSKPIDMIGKVCSNLTALKRVENSTKNRRATFLCQCVCGNTCEVTGKRLRTGHTKSCGCLWLKHGHCAGPRSNRSANAYNTYRSMLSRCFEPTNKKYADYGGRGITVCTEWLGESGTEKFVSYILANLGKRPKGMTLHRIDNEGNYRPGNVKWADASEQATYRRPKSIVLKRQGTTSKFLGVHLDASRNKWVSSLSDKHNKGKKDLYQGRFDKELDAAWHRDLAVVRFNAGTVLNFPELRPQYEKHIESKLTAVAA